MSGLTGDRNSQQQPQQLNQNHQTVQPGRIRNPTTPQPQQNLQSSGSFIIINSSTNVPNANNGILRTPSNIVNTIPNSICYSTPPNLANQIAATNAAPVSSQSTPTSHLDPTSPIAKKRLKLEIGDSSSSCGSTNTVEDLVALKTRITDHKSHRIKTIVAK